jgi:hypothetical protein
MIYAMTMPAATGMTLRGGEAALPGRWPRFVDRLDARAADEAQVVAGGWQMRHPRLGGATGTSARTSLHDSRRAP